MDIKKRLGRLKYHPLIQVLGRNKGNPRTLVLIEPLWGIPYNLIAPFATLYMYTQGVTDVQIGLILSITMVVQVCFSFFAGILADKLGRKTTTMMGDFIGWGLACLVWAASQNFWLFLLAALLNCFEQINQTAWYCLLIEDADQRDLVGLYTWINIGGLVAIFFAPISGMLVSANSVVPVVRVLYLLFALTMMTKCFITYKFCHETRQGQVRKAETKGVSPFRMLGEYRQLIPMLLKNRGGGEGGGGVGAAVHRQRGEHQFLQPVCDPAAGAFGQLPGAVPHPQRRGDAGVYGGHPAQAERPEVSGAPVGGAGAVRRGGPGAAPLPSGEGWGLCC